MKRCFTLILLITASHAFSQDWPLKKIISAKKEQHMVFTPFKPFAIVARKNITTKGSYEQLQADPSFSIRLLAERPAAIALSIPLAEGKTIDFELAQFSLGNIKYTENNDLVLQDIKIPVTYRGIIAGDTGKTLVTLTVNDEYLSLVAVMADKTVLQVTKADETNPNAYRLYDSRRISFPPLVSINCGTIDKPEAKTANGIDITGSMVRPLAVNPKCVNVFVDCFDSLYQFCSSSKQRTVNYVYELFNSVTTGYLVEQVNIQITTINVWTTKDPYRGDSREHALADLAANYKDNFWGNICVGLDYSVDSVGRAGLAGALGKIKAVSTNTCPAYKVNDNPFCYCDLNYNVSVLNFPTGPNTTGQQVYLVMHEMGHLLGAHHTKWCGWKLTSNPDTYGALDSCGVIEGSCAQGPPPDINGATIMSYCVRGRTRNDYVNYINGFGLLPGNAIRNFIDQSSCLLDCSDCFGSLHPSDTGNLLAGRNPAPVQNTGSGHLPNSIAYPGLLLLSKKLITHSNIKQ